MFVVRSGLSRVLSADVTSLFGNRLDLPTRLGSGLRDSTRLEHESIDSIDRIDRFRGLDTGLAVVFRMRRNM